MTFSFTITELSVFEYKLSVCKEELNLILSDRKTSLWKYLKILFAAKLWNRYKKCIKFWQFKQLASLNHGVVWIGRGPKDHLVPVPRKGYFPLDQVPSSLPLNTSRNGPVLHHPHSEEFSLISNPDLFQYYAITPCPIDLCPCKTFFSTSLVCLNHHGKCFLAKLSLPSTSWE